MRNIYTSVDIGSDQIKIVTLESYKGNLNISACSSVKSFRVKKD